MHSPILIFCGSHMCSSWIMKLICWRAVVATYSLREGLERSRNARGRTGFTTLQFKLSDVTHFHLTNQIAEFYCAVV